MDSNLKQVAKIDVYIDDALVNKEVANVITELTIVQSFQQPCQCKLQLSMTKEHYADQLSSQVEQSRLELRTQEDDKILFAGIIGEFVRRYGAERDFLVQITAYDALYFLSLSHPVHSFIDVTLVDIAEQMMSPYGVTIEAEDTGPLWGHLVQYQSSSLEFLQELSERCGLYFYLHNNVFHLARLSTASKFISLDYNSSLIELMVHTNQQGLEVETRVSGWDPLRTKLFKEDALQTSENNSTVLPGVQEHHQTTIVDQPAQSEHQLEVLAEAQTLRIKAIKNYVTGVAEGDPELHPGTDIQLAGLLSVDNEQQYRLTQVTHNIKLVSGYITTFSSQPPVLNQRSKSPLVSYGIISQISDPQALGRVKVILPTYNNIESDWLEVVIPGAGKGKGIIALPAIDDKVLILMLHQRIEQAVVLGGLYGEDGLPEEIIVDGEVSRYSILTPNGQGLRLNDQEESINLFNKSDSRIDLQKDSAVMSTASGSQLEMTTDAMLLNAETPLVIQAPGKTITIRASKINFERA